MFQPRSARSLGHFGGASMIGLLLSALAWHVRNMAARFDWDIEQVFTILGHNASWYAVIYSTAARPTLCGKIVDASQLCAVMITVIST